jgi:hypothetical protein
MRNSVKDFSGTLGTTGKVLPFHKGKIIKRELYCIPCAVEQPDFKERAPSYESGTYDHIPANRAWINGRSFTLLRHPALKEICSRCGNVTPSVYGIENHEEVPGL